MANWIEFPWYVETFQIIGLLTVLLASVGVLRAGLVWLQGRRRSVVRWVLAVQAVLGILLLGLWFPAGRFFAEIQRFELSVIGTPQPALMPGGVLWFVIGGVGWLAVVGISLMAWAYRGPGDDLTAR